MLKRTPARAWRLSISCVLAWASACQAYAAKGVDAAEALVFSEQPTTVESGAQCLALAREAPSQLRLPSQLCRLVEPGGTARELAVKAGSGSVAALYRRWGPTVTADSVQGSRPAPLVAGKPFRHFELVVLSSPVKGQESAYNDWYDNAHIQDVLRNPGFKAAHRLKLINSYPAAIQLPRYVVIFELDSADLNATVAEVSKRVADGTTRPSPAFDKDSRVSRYYEVKAAQSAAGQAVQVQYVVVTLSNAAAQPDKRSGSELTLQSNVAHGPALPLQMSLFEAKGEEGAQTLIDEHRSAELTLTYEKLGPHVRATEVAGHADAPKIAGAVKHRFLLYVLSNPAQGQEQAYNDYYDHQHIADVLRVPGFLEAQRLRLRSVSSLDFTVPRYAILFYLDSYDLQATMDEVHRRLATGETKRSPSFDIPSSTSRYYEVTSG